MPLPAWHYLFRISQDVSGSSQLPRLSLGGWGVGGRGRKRKWRWESNSAITQWLNQLTPSRPLWQPVESAAAYTPSWPTCHTPSAPPDFSCPPPKTFSASWRCSWQSLSTAASLPASCILHPASPMNPTSHTPSPGPLDSFKTKSQIELLLQHGSDAAAEAATHCCTWWWKSVLASGKWLKVI